MAAWASKMFKMFPGCLKEKEKAETFTPQFPNHGHFSEEMTSQWGSLWATSGGKVATPLIQSKTSKLSKGIWGAKPTSGIWKKVLWSVLEFAWGLFNFQNLQSSAYPELLLCGSDIQDSESRAERIDPVRRMESPPPLLCLLPFWGNLLCLGFA